MDITSATKVGDIATMVPAAIEVFERYGVDFCCNGKRPLDEALRGTGLSVGDILAEIERATEAQAQEDELHQDWSGYAPGTLADHIEATHHGYLRAELPKIGARMATVLSVHGERHPELFELGRLFEKLRRELDEHLAKEEQVVFPMLRTLDTEYEGSGPGSTRAWTPEALRAELASLEAEHGDVGDALKSIRGLTSNYQTPADACITYSTLYRELQGLEVDIHRHVHLENNILIPTVRTLAES